MLFATITGVGQDCAAVLQSIVSPVQLTKALAKKLKLSKDACEILVTRLIEAQLAFDFQGPQQLPVALDDRVGKTHELLAMADERTFGKGALEDIVAHLTACAPADILVRSRPAIVEAV